MLTKKDRPMLTQFNKSLRDEIAIKALVFLAENPERLSRFFNTTGIEPQTIRKIAESDTFLAEILNYMQADEPLLLAFSAEKNISNSTILALRKHHEI